MKENSIEEDIKIAERFIKSIKTDKEYKKEGWHGYFNEEIVELARILEHILSDYKRVLKENEELNNRCKNLDEEAQAYVEELMGDSTLKDRIINRLNKENEEWQKAYQEEKDIQFNLIKENQTLKSFVSGIFNENIEKDFIPVQKVKDKIEELKEKEQGIKENEWLLCSSINHMKIHVLQELLEKEK